MSDKYVSTLTITESSTGVPTFTPKNTIKLHLGCDKKMFININLNNKRVTSYFNHHIKQLAINSEDITAITVGPKTVLEAYGVNNLVGKKRLIINDTEDKEKILHIGCAENHPVSEGSVRSFIIWDYDYYFEVFGVRYCDKDSQCKDYEYCLCKGGQRDPNWCPRSKKRCLPVSRYIQSRHPYPKNYDYVNTDCLKNNIDKEITPNFITFADLAKRSNSCSVTSYEGDNRLLEGFSVNNKKMKLWFILVIIFIILFIIKKLGSL